MTLSISEFNSNLALYLTVF